MSGRKLLQSMSGLALVVSLLAGCAGAQAVPTATPVPPTAMPTHTPVPPTATLTQTPMPPTPTPLPPPTATPTPVPPSAMPESISWDYVALGDSIGGSFPYRYAEHIEADLGVEIKMHSWYSSNQSSDQMLTALRNNQQLRSDLREAEVVTFMVGSHRLQDPHRAYRAETCGGTDNQDCMREALVLLNADTDAIIAEILSLRSTSDTIIRAMTYYCFVVNDGKKWGYFEGLNPYWVAYNEYLVQAASVHDIPVARADLVFNGPNLDEDPSDKDLLSDGVHPNAEGIALIAGMFRELGYEPLAP
jgi:hypothetical protein